MAFTTGKRSREEIDEVDEFLRVSPSRELEPPPQLPTDNKGYYACRKCRRILTEPQWYKEGCLECNTGPLMRSELVEFATTKFSHFVGLVAPEKSWLARVIGKNTPQSSNGIYAEALSSEDEDDFEEEDEAEEEEDRAGEDDAPAPTASTKLDIEGLEDL